MYNDMMWSPKEFNQDMELFFDLLAKAPESAEKDALIASIREKTSLGDALAY